MLILLYRCREEEKQEKAESEWDIVHEAFFSTSGYRMRIS